MNTSNQILSFKQASKKLNVGLSTVYKLANSGELTAFRLGGAWRTSEQACNEYIQRRIAVEKEQHGWFGENDSIEVG